MRFATWVFRIAGATGLLLIVPPLFMEYRTGKDYPPAINHPEYYYGFFGVTLAWQILFLVIGSDPVRYRPAMLTAVLEKAGFVVAIAGLYLAGRVHPIWIGFAALDATWLVLFIVAFLRTPKQASESARPHSGSP
jgi:hypothetical protein